MFNQNDRTQLQTTAINYIGGSFMALFLLFAFYGLFFSDLTEVYKRRFHKKMIEVVSRRFKVEGPCLETFPDFSELRVLEKGLFDYQNFYKRLHILSQIQNLAVKNAEGKFEAIVIEDGLAIQNEFQLECDSNLIDNLKVGNNQQIVLVKLDNVQFSSDSLKILTKGKIIRVIKTNAD